MLEGGKSGPVLVPGHPEKSRLIEAIRYKNPDLQMPPDDPLPPAVVADFEAWVRMGAPDPRVNDPKAVSFAKAARHWSFQPPRDRPVPAVKNTRWPLTAVDAFVLARPRASGAFARAAGGQTDAHPPRHLRPDGPSANPCRDRRVRSRRSAGCFRSCGRSPAGVTSVWRAVGTALAGRRPLCRHDRAAPGAHTLFVHVSRLGDPRLQRRPALRRVSSEAVGRGQAAGVVGCP